MPIMKYHVCEFCGKNRKYTAKSPHHGFFCVECIGNIRRDELKALDEIRAARSKDSLNAEWEKMR